MAEVQAPVTYKCDGCSRHFDSEADLAPARVGKDALKYCRRCYVTGLGPQYPLSFEKAQELGQF